QMGQMNLIPFLNFPDITLQFQAVKFYEKELTKETTGQDPILSLEEIGVTLDMVELIRGGIMVSKARLKDGFVHMEVYKDTITNLEHALGIRFGAQIEKDTIEKTTPLAIDLKKIELINIRARMDNQVMDEHVSVEVNRLVSSFSYLSGKVRAALEVDIDINRVKYQTINDQIDKSVKLKGSIILDPDAHIMKVEPSSLSVSGLEFETWGSLDYRTPPRVDFAYTATNEGLELLNYLFRGVLDLEEIEQIGGGSIHLNGTVQGGLGGDILPVIRVNGDAEELGFRIKSLDKDVTGISFHLFATNGSKSDLSEGYIDVQDFSAHFPEGYINADITAGNIISPELNVEVDCAVNLEGLEEMLNKKYLTSLSGSVAIQGQISGSVNRKAGRFLNDGGSLAVILDDLSFVINHDSVTKDSIKSICGEFVLHDTIFGTEKLAMEFNGNQFDVGIYTENLLLYLLDYNRDVTTGISISSELLTPAILFRDTAISNMLGEEIHGLHFSAEAKIGKEDLDDFLEQDSIPEIEISLDSFGILLPFLAEISNVSAALTFGPDSVSLHHLDGTIGESSFDFSGMLINYGALAQADSGGVVSLDFDISSGLMRAEDLFTINNEFLLPQTYKTEYLEDFRLTGRLEAPAMGLVHDSVSLDFEVDIEDLGWSFRYYPLTFKDFLIRMKREGDLLLIDNFQGSIGESNLKLSASLGNFTDSLVENMYGSFELHSDLLDFNQLLNYQQPEEVSGVRETDSAEVREPLRLNEVDYPQIDITVDIGELLYEKHKIYGINGKFRSSREKIFYLDRFVISPEGRGTLKLNGHLNVSNPDLYSSSVDLDLKGIDISDLNLEFQTGDTILALKDNFQGVVDAGGLAEIFITPELKVDMPTTTAMFNVKITDGAIINFTPLQAAGKFMDSKDLNNVRFATFQNSFPLTLVDSRVIIPLTIVESTLGQMLIEGEQGLDNSYLYLVRVPTKLAMEAARSAMSEGGKEDGEDQVIQMKRGRFVKMTVWSDGEESEVKLGDKREDYQ
ncbi:MAG: hypothetical protein K8R52_06310, partial [Bacteroidales bacterium]|nr:hypothetical protein [Bacteroidales bacterium]